MQESIYDPGAVAFGGGSSASVIHPLIMAIVVFIAILTFTLPRKNVIMPLVLGMLLIPHGQNLVIGGFHLYMLRLLVLLGWARVGISCLSSSEKLLPGGLNVLDKVFLVWALYHALATVLLYKDVGAAANQAGFLMGSVGSYFLFRSLLKDESDVIRAVKALAVVAVVAAAGMMYEQMKGQNFFAFLGGLQPVPEMREGRIRSQAVFGHALLAGAYGATTFCLFLWLWKRSKTWLFPLIGMTACLAMVYAASTSTPILALMGGIFAVCLWPLREHMRLLRWGVIILLLGLQLVMKAPVWFLIGRIDLSGGSTGYHRAMLIDNFVRHFGDWWLIGTHDNVNWGWDMWDRANQYVNEGESGGLIAFVGFLALFFVCYRWLGSRRKALRGENEKEQLVWIIGAALFSQNLAFIGVDYFDQSVVTWFLLLVIITVVAYLPMKETTLIQSSIAVERAPLIRKRWDRERRVIGTHIPTRG